MPANLEALLQQSVVCGLLPLCLCRAWLAAEVTRKAITQLPAWQLTSRVLGFSIFVCEAAPQPSLAVPTAAATAQPVQHFMMQSSVWYDSSVDMLWLFRHQAHSPQRRGAARPMLLPYQTLDCIMKC